MFEPLDNMSLKEVLNAQQAFRTWREATLRLQRVRGSLVWSEVGGRRYLMRSSYSPAGKRIQRSLGPESLETQAIMSDFHASRMRLTESARHLRDVLDKHAAICRALRLGRVPLLVARIIRAVDDAGFLGGGLRVLGTNALYAFEAAAGIWFNGAIAATEDIDFLLDGRAGLIFAGTMTEDGSASFLSLLKKVDRSFERTNARFRAANRDGFLVDLIQPLREPVMTFPTLAISAALDDLSAVEIEGLVWHENAPAFEAVALDASGLPVRIVTSDPRVFAAHKLWLSKRLDREAGRRPRDQAQARAVANVCTQYFQHLPYRAEDLRMLPEVVFEAAKPLFASGA